MSVILDDLLNGTGALSAHSPDIGGAWTSASIALTGSGAAVNSAPDIEESLVNAAAATTPNYTASAEVLPNSGGTKFLRFFLNDGFYRATFSDGDVDIRDGSHSVLASALGDWFNNGGAPMPVSVERTATQIILKVNGATVLTHSAADHYTAPTSTYITMRTLVLHRVTVVDAAAASPVVSTPVQTLTGTTRTTAGATIDSGGTTGTLYALARTGGSAALSGPIISGGQSNATTGTGAKTVPGTVLAAGTANQYVDMVYVDATNGTSNVVTVGPITTASALSFSGTIPTQNVTVGASVDIDLSSYFSGTGFGALAYSSIGASIAGASSGLSLNTTTGHITGTAGAAQTISGVQVRKADSGSAVSQADSNTFNIVISAGGSGPTINTQPTTQTAKVGAAATWTMAATSSGGTLSRQWKFNGGNVGSDSNSYTRSGIVLGDHGATVVCRATDDNGFTDTATVSLVVAVTFAGTVPAQSGTEGGSFSLALASYFSGGLSRTYAVHSGTLPTGTSLNASTGAITGTLGVAGSGSFVVRATDANSNTDDTGTISWTISAPGTGTLTSSTLCNNEGLVFADTPFTCFVRNEDSGDLILKKTGLVSDGQGVATFSDGSLPAAGTIVDVRWRNEDNGESGYELLPVE